MRCKDAMIAPDMVDVWLATQGVIDQAEQDGAEHLALCESPYLDECVRKVREWAEMHRHIMRALMDTQHELAGLDLTAGRRRHLKATARVFEVSLGKASVCGLTYAGMVEGYVFRQQEEQAEVQSWLGAVVRGAQ